VSDARLPLDILKKTPVIVSVVVAVVVVLIWLVAFFLPQGSKISKLDSQVQTLQSKVTAGNQKLAILKRESLTNSKLTAELATLKNYVPTAPDVYTYIGTITATVKSAGCKLVSLSPSGEGAASSGSSFYQIPVDLSVTGTYDHLLRLISDIYALPRLTIIPTMNISGGGPGTNRSTTLSATLDLETFTTSPPPTNVP
jgi:Tfp pilus assembly protein PilO